MSLSSVFHVRLEPSCSKVSSPLTFLISFRSDSSLKSPADAEFFSQSDTVISSGVPSAAAFTYTVSSFEISVSAASTGLTPITIVIPTATEAATTFFLFLFMFYDSFSSHWLHLYVSIIMYVFCYFLSGKNPLDV